jgi:hypothetical protein
MRVQARLLADAGKAAAARVGLELQHLLQL